MIHDLRQALRALRTRPGPSLLAVLCLSIGIGANMALFGVVDTLVLRPPTGARDPEGLVRVRVGIAYGDMAAAAGPTATYPAYERVLSERGALFESLAAYGGGPSTAGAGTGARPIASTIVSPSYFGALGLEPRIGRFFEVAEGAKDAAIPVAVISHRFWREEYDANADALGRSLRVGDVDYTIVGVAPEGFVGVDLGDTDAWLPTGMVGVLLGGYGPGAGWLQMIGRLRPGLDFDGALALLGAELGAADEPLTVSAIAPEDLAQREAGLPLTLLPLRPMFFWQTQGEVPVPAWALGLSAAVLLLACATVANLLLAQAVRRRREVAIRLALGGSPARILRTQLVGSFVIALASAAGAALLALLSVSLVRRLPIPEMGALLNLRTFAFGLAVALVTPLLFGVLPGLWAAGHNVNDVLKKSASTATPAGVQRGLMVAQVAIAFSLLLVGGLFLQSLARVRDVPVGWDIERLVSVEGVPSEHTAAVETRLRALPQVTAVGTTSIIPFYSTTGYGTRIDDGRPEEEQPSSRNNQVGPEFFRAMGIPLLAGRAFDESDRMGSSPVAIVSETFANQGWSGASPLGACLVFGAGIPRRLFGERCAEVVGVVADAKFEPLTGTQRPMVYLASEQFPTPGGTLVVRTDVDPASLVPAVRTAVMSAAPDMPFPVVRPMTSLLGPSTFRWTVAANVFVALGLLATLLAAIGVYGLVAFLAEQRTREMGIRSALGAGRARLVQLVLTDGARITAAGLLVGVVMALALARIFASRLYGIGFAEPSAYLAVALGLFVVAMLASLRPALRAGAADPAIVLREE